jgi:hypothetical protein
MTNKDVSRRGFLKGMVQSVSAAGLATFLKFMPEAKGILAGERSVQYDVRLLTHQQAESLKQGTVDEANSEILHDYLEKHGFEEVPGVYFAYRTIFDGQDEGGRSLKSQIDILFVGCSNVNEENRGAMFVFAKDSDPSSSQWQLPIVVVQDDALYYVKDGEVEAYEDKNNPIITASWFSSIEKGVSPVNDQGIAPVPLQNASCEAQRNQCLVLGTACGVLSICCGAGGLPCCYQALAACSSGAAACAIWGQCCDANPGASYC